jgi:hypothetical protein
MQKKTPIKTVTKHDMMGLVCWYYQSSSAFSTGILMKFASIKSISTLNIMSKKYDSVSSNPIVLDWNGLMEVQHLANCTKN